MRTKNINYSEVETLIRTIRSANHLATMWERDAIKEFIEPMLRALGWDTEDSSQVSREFKLGMNRVDFILNGLGNRLMPLEAKRPSQNLRDHERQLLLYAFEEGMPFAGLTNACEWWLYRTMENGHWKTRKFCEINLMKGDISGTVTMLDKFLSRTRFTQNSIESTTEKALNAWRKMNPIPFTHNSDKRIRQTKTNDYENLSGMPENFDSVQNYPNPHSQGTKMRLVFEALREAWVTGEYLSDLTGQKGGWQRWNQKHYVDSGRYGRMVMLWKKGRMPSPMHLATEQEAESLLADPEITIYPD